MRIYSEPIGSGFFRAEAPPADSWNRMSVRFLLGSHDGSHNKPCGFFTCHFDY
jgi:hypothetical protein